MTEDGPAASRRAGRTRRVFDAPRRARRTLLIAGLVGFASLSLSLSMAWKPPLFLLWNVSTSAPRGLYSVRSAAAIRRGDLVAARIPETARRLAAERHYLPVNVPAVKRVAALAGDRICAAGPDVSINGMRVAARSSLDRAGRPMPWWNGCRRLGAAEYFLLNPNPLSFDGRYFGVVPKSLLIGRAELLWAR